MKKTNRRVCGAVVAMGLAAAGATAWVARAATPTERFTASTDTVRDNETQLVWQRAVPSPTYTWAAARSYCEGLNAQNLGGFSAGWRLPTQKELVTIVDMCKFNPSIDSIAFPDTPPEVFWSSSVYAYDTSLAWNVHFFNGDVGYDDQSYTYRVRCVR